MGLKNLTKNIYFLPHEPEVDRPMLAYVKGDKFSLAVDAGYSKKHVQDFYRALRSCDLKEPDFTVITHWHYDHTFGLHDISGVSIAHQKTNLFLREQQDRAKDKKYIEINSNINEDAYDTFDMIVNLEKCDKLESIIKNCVNLSYDREKQLFTLSFTQGGYGRTNRSVSLDKLNNFRVLCDTSSLEIFINNGEEVFTNRFYPTKDNVGINLSGENLKGSICIYEMEAYKIEN